MFLRSSAKPFEWKPEPSKLQLSLRSPAGILAALLFLMSGVQSMADAASMAKIYTLSLEFDNNQLHAHVVSGTNKTTVMDLGKNIVKNYPKVNLTRAILSEHDGVDLDLDLFTAPKPGV